MRGKEIYTGWTPLEVARHYGLTTEPDGTGQALAIIDMGEVLDLDELKLDFDKLGVAMPDIRIVDFGGDAMPQLGTAAIETHIDVEVIGSLCPNAKIRVYRCGFNFPALADAITRAVADDVDVISISWGTREDALGSGDIARIEDALRQSRKAGVTVCAASGDAGASGMTDRKTHVPIPDPKGGVHCIYPGSSAQVLSCGGTQIMEVGEVRREVAWNNTASGGRATGGGVSRQFELPDWQAGIQIASLNRGSGPGRIVPDVAAAAAVRDWTFYDQSGKVDLEGGTSAVAPFFAALIALANQQRKAAGKPRLGFVNDRLYGLVPGGGLFTDITEGNNANTPHGPGYAARKGFDACTGWGTPRADALIEALVQLP